jgi:hypothetical protein
MGASDYMVGNAPQGASYTAPNVGAQFGQMIGDYPKDYFEGKQRQRQLAVMDAFPNGVPPGSTVNDLMSTIAKAGGGTYVQQLLPFMIQQQISHEAGQALGGMDVPAGANTSPGATPQGAATGPAGVTPRPQQPPPAQPLPQQGNQPLSATGQDNNGADTVRSIFSEGAGGRDVLTQINSAARTLRLNPDAPLTPEQAQRVKSFRSNAVGLSDESGKPPQGEVAAQPAVQTAQAAPSRDDSALGNEGALKQRMDSLNNAASRIETYGATMAAVNPATSTAALAKAKAMREEAARIFEYISKGDQASYEHQLRNTDKTEALKNAEAGGFKSPYEENAAKLHQETVEQNARLTEPEKIARANSQPTPLQNTIATKAVESQMKRSDSMYQGSNARSMQFEQTLKPMLGTTKALLNRPEMYTGFGGDKLLEFNKVRALMGDKNAAVLQEAMGKITAQSVLSTINEQRDEMQEAGGTSARIFSQQVDQVAKAAPQMSNTVAGNRFLVNVALKMGDVSTKISQMQRDYLKTHPYLDVEFDQKLSDYLQKNPVFTDAEMRDPRVLGAPDVPAGADKWPMAKLQAWEKRMGLKPGDFFRTPDGAVQIPTASAPTLPPANVTP